MTTAEVLTSLQNSAIAHAISKSNHLVGASLQVVHVIGFILLLGSLLFISLRLLGFTLFRETLADITRDAHRLLHAGLGLAIVSGVLMFVATPKLYFYKPVFELKMALFAVVVLLQFTVIRRLATRESTNLWFARTATSVSLIGWFGIAFAGRFIGFT